MAYEERFYRGFHINEEMLRIKLEMEESDLLVIVEPCDSHEAIEGFLYDRLGEVRGCLKEHFEKYPKFFGSLEPLELPEDIAKDLPETIGVSDSFSFLVNMYHAGEKAGVGPMAAVAGITSEVLGKHLMERYGPVDILIENGGDIFLHAKKERYVSIYAGSSILSNKFNLRIRPECSPIGICTSAGTVGHSLSFGKADAVVVLSKDTALADAVATRLGNEVRTEADIQRALELGMAIEGVEGVVVILGDKLGAIGKIEFA